MALISISVDPTTDVPVRLKAHAEKFGAADHRGPDRGGGEEAGARHRHGARPRLLMGCGSARRCLSPVRSQKRAGTCARRWPPCSTKSNGRAASTDARSSWSSRNRAARPARRAAEHGYRAGHFSAAAAAEQVSRARPAYVFAFGSAAEIEDLARQMDRSEFGAFGAAMRTAGAKIQT